MTRSTRIILGSLLWLFLATSAAPLLASDRGASSDITLEYIKLVQQHVDKNWSYKKTLDNQFYSLLATVTVNRDGKVLDTMVDRLSTDEEFNAEALRQLGDMEPFPRFPETMVQEIFEIRIHLMPNAH